MSGVDLSQSMTEQREEARRGLFDMGVITSILRLVIVAAGWGGLRYYMTTIDKKIAAFDEAIAANTLQLEGDHIDRVADFDARTSLLGSDPAESVEPHQLLTQVESAMVNGVVLTDYEYDEAMKQVALGGKVGNFRQLAEQMLSFKSEQVFSEVTVDTINRDDDGQITFSLTALSY